MSLDPIQVENTIRNAVPVVYLKFEQLDGCADNYSLILVSEAFEGKSTLAKHRFINQLLKDEIAKMHAFSQKVFTPKQYEAFLAKET